MILWLHRRMSLFRRCLPNCFDVKCHDVCTWPSNCSVKKKKKTLGIFYSHVHFTLLPPSSLAQCLGPRYSGGSTKMFLNILLKLKDKKWISRSNILTYSIHNSPLCQHSHKIEFKICVYWGRGTEKCLWPRKAIKWFSMPPLEFKLQAVPDQWFLGYYGRSTECQVWP